MRLKQVEISNFQSIRELSMEWGDLNVLVGPNNSGKSAVLHALNLAQMILKGQVGQLLGAPVSELLRLGERSGRIAVSWTATQADLRPLAGSPWMTSQPQGDIPLSVSIQFSSDQWVPDKISIGANQLSLAFTPGSSDWTISSLAAPLSNIPQRPSAIPVRSLTDSSGPFHGPTFSPLQWLGKQQFAYDPVRVGNAQESLAGTNALSPQGEGMVRVLTQWTTSHDSRLNILNRLLNEIVPGEGLIGVDLRNNNQHGAVIMRRPDQSFIPVTRMGTGVFQLVMLLYHLVAKEVPILFIEEPEVHLHPQAQRLLFREIVAAAKTQQVFLSTHSPLFVDRRRHEHNFLVTRDDPAGTRVRAMNDRRSLDVVRDALGITLGDTLYGADVVVVVSGWSDAAFIRAIAERIPDDAPGAFPLERVALIPLGRSAELNSLLKSLSVVHDRIIVILDRSKHEDQAVREAAKNELVQSDNVLWLRPEEEVGEYELEDSMPHSLYFRVVGSHYGVDLSESVIAEATRRVCERQHCSGDLPRSRLCLEALNGLEVLDKAAGEHDYDKIAVAAAVAQEYPLDELPDWYRALARQVNTLLGREEPVTR